MRMTIFALVAVVLATACTAGGMDRPLVFGINRVGGEGALHEPPGYGEDMYRRLREIGSTMVRLAASPRDIERVRGTRDWDSFMADVDLAVKYGMEPMVCIVNTPAWASPTGEDTHLWPYKEELWPEFADFCRDLATRCRGKARLYQIWNEQNGCSWHFHDGFNHADEYAPILRIAYNALKEADPTCMVLMGSLDDAEGYGHLFLNLMYEEREKRWPGERFWDGISDHPYSWSSQIMKERVLRLREIMADHGDGDLPVYITEYGWHSPEIPPADQVKLFHQFLDEFQRPELSCLLGCIHLCLADFEGTQNGFGACDANLRPKPSFYAFQGHPRFGASPPYMVEAVPADPHAVRVRWKTALPASCRLQIRPSTGGRFVGYPVWDIAGATGPANEHEVMYGRLESGRRYAYLVTSQTPATKGVSGKVYHSATYEYRCPDAQVFNGDFEGDFFGGIAEGWSITGEAFCTPASVYPGLGPRGGADSQVIFAHGVNGQVLDTTLAQVVAPPAGMRRLTAWLRGSAGAPTWVIEARLGLGTGGGTDPGAEGITWSDWTEVGSVRQMGSAALEMSQWVELSVAASATSDLTSLFVQVRATGESPEGEEKPTVAVCVDAVVLR